MFDLLYRVLRGADRVEVTLARAADGRPKVFIAPVLGSEPRNLSDEDKQLRASLALPILVIAESDEKLEAELRDALERVVPARDYLAGEVEASLARIEDQARKARTAAAARSAKSAELPKSGAPSTQGRNKSKSKPQGKKHAQKKPAGARVALPAPTERATGEDVTVPVEQQLPLAV